MQKTTEKVLAIDLDGSLIKTDLLYESLMLLIKKNILYLFCLPFWVLQGKVSFKYQVLRRVKLDAALLPYNNDVIDYIKAVRKKGVPCYLVTGSLIEQAHLVADYLGLFDDVYGTERQGKNLTGNNKAAFLNQQFGQYGYDYIGNSHVDLTVWKDAHKAIVVSSSQSLFDKASSISNDVVWLQVEKPTLKTFMKAMRVHQWVKNTLMIVPLITAHLAFQLDLIWLCALGFISFSFVASSVYLLNDLMDLSSDRQHPNKCRRPFASGALSIRAGLLLIPLLLFTAFAFCFYLPVEFFIALIVYYVITLAYSFKLKEIVLVDTITLAVLYTMRIIAGTLIISVDFSYWLLAFSIFIFLSLALVKRYVELLMLRKNNQLSSVGRGYHIDDDAIIASLGTAAGFIAVLVMALYINSSAVVILYQHANILWVVCLILLYWISRIWLLAHRGEMNDDPILFAVKDINSLITAGCILILFLLAI